MNDEIFNRLISPHRWLSQNFIFIGEYDTITLLLVYYNFLFARPINYVINSGLKTLSRIFRTSVSRATITVSFANVATNTSLIVGIPFVNTEYRRGPRHAPVTHLPVFCVLMIVYHVPQLENIVRSSKISFHNMEQYLFGFVK